jgi:transcriptional regulator GlxA family with amidase domain
MTPHQWLIRERLLQVQCLLETTDESVDRIARR